MKRKLPLIIVTIAALTAAGVKIANDPAEDAMPMQTPPQPAGYVIHIDPATGQLTDPAPGTAPLVIDPGLQNALSTSGDGLVEVPSEAPGGGTMVDLQGRFQSTMVSTVGKNGTLQAPCFSGLPDSCSSEPGKTGKGGGEE
jgi:hypothetical protein